MKDVLDYDAEKNPGIFDQLLQLTPDSVIDRVRCPAKAKT